MTVAEELAPRCCRPRRMTEGRCLWRVWAPKAMEVTLLLWPEDAPIPLKGDDAKHVPLHAMEDGYFEIALPEIAAGQRYAYQLDGGPPRPDPCSLSQPEGVHAPSAVVFPETFEWTDRDWRSVARGDLVFYELHVGTFTQEGTFEAVIPRLKALRDLGVTALEIMPVAQFPGARNWGYDGVGLFAAQNSYGGVTGLQKLVDAAHREGLAVYLDVVYNHFGPEGNYVSEYGPWFSERYRTVWGSAFNYDGAGSDPVRGMVLDNVWYWLTACHLDGLRLDAVHSMFDNSPWHILSEVKLIAEAASRTLGFPTAIVVESLMNDIRMLLPPERGGYALDAEWNEDFHHALIAYLTGERHGKYIDFGDPALLVHVLNETFQLSGIYSRFRKRRWGRPVGDLPGDRFVVGIQNHDHVGNRALGERLASLLPPATQRMAASLMIFSPHLPFLFMGEEYGERNPFLFFCDFSDEQLIENVRTGRRRDYDLVGHMPDPQGAETFEASKLSWSWPEGSEHAAMRRLYRDLLTLRRMWPAMTNVTERSATLIPSAASPGPEQERENAASPPAVAGVLQLIRGDKEPVEGKTLTMFFNLTALRQPLPSRAIASDVLLFSSENSRYSVQATSPVENELLPFECRVYGPVAWVP